MSKQFQFLSAGIPEPGQFYDMNIDDIYCFLNYRLMTLIKSQHKCVPGSKVITIIIIIIIIIKIIIAIEKNID